MRDNPLPFRLAIRYDPAMTLRPRFDRAWSRSLAGLALAATLLIGGHAFGQAAKAPPEVTASSVFVVNADTGQVLYAKNPDKVFRILSITKLITAYLLMQRLGGELSDQVTIAQADLVPGSTAGLRKGDVWSLQDLLYGMLLVSGNDAAMAIADYTGRKMLAAEKKRGNSIKRFVQGHAAHRRGARGEAQPICRSLWSLAVKRLYCAGCRRHRKHRLSRREVAAVLAMRPPNREHRRPTGAHGHDQQHDRDARR